MAETDYIKYHGKIKDGEDIVQPELTIEFDDRQHATISIVNKWNIVKEITAYPGDKATALRLTDDDIPLCGTYYIQTVRHERLDYDVGKITATLVRAPKGKSKPFAITYTIEMKEVQKNLETHPLLRPATATASTKWYQKEIRKWNLTPDAARIEWDDQNEPVFFLNDFDVNGNTMLTKTEVKSDGAKKYCAAKTAGIEHFNLYLPVIQKTSLYIELDGAERDPETHEIRPGCTIKILDNGEKIGQYCSPPIKLQGYTDESQGAWFKSVDQWQMNSDCTWQRTEEWVYTNDLTHKWIYSDSLNPEE